MVCISSSINSVRASGGTADTPVLGTGLARGESSSLSSPTKQMATLMDTFSYAWIRSRKKGVLVVQGFMRHVSLRN